MRFFQSILLVLVLSLSVMMAAADSTTPPRISSHLSLLTRDGNLTAYEPVLVKVEERNDSTDTVTVASASPESEQIIIEDANGRVIASRLRSPSPAFIRMVGGGSHLKPGESRSRILAVSAIYPFDKPGIYTVRIENSTEAHISFVVKPFDPARLKARCEELFKSEEQSSTDRELSAGDKVRALLSARHEIALPYIDWWARNLEPYRACIAMRLMGTPSSMRELHAFAKRSDSLGKSARCALETSMEDIVWAMLER